MLAYIVALDWASILFWGLVLFSIFTLKRFEKNNRTFYLVAFISGPDGKADKYSLAYCVVLFIGGWGIWYQATHGGITEWLWTSFIGAFVLGAVAKTAAGVAERVKIAQAENPQPQPPGDNVGQQVIVTPEATTTDKTK